MFGRWMGNEQRGNICTNTPQKQDCSFPPSLVPWVPEVMQNPTECPHTYPQEHGRRQLPAMTHYTSNVLYYQTMSFSTQDLSLYLYQVAHC